MWIPRLSDPIYAAAGLGAANDRDQFAERPLLDEVVPACHAQGRDHAGRSPLDVSHHLRLDLRSLVREVDQHHVFDQKPLDLDVECHRPSVCGVKPPQQSEPWPASPAEGRLFEVNKAGHEAGLSLTDALWIGGNFIEGAFAMRRLIAVIALLAAIAAGAAFAATTKLSIAAASNSDLGVTMGDGTAAVPHIGVGGGTGWLLVVDTATAARSASADLAVTGKVDGRNLKKGAVVTELGFDIYTPGGVDVFDAGSLCGTSTRLDFENSATGGVYSLNCNEGTHTDLGGGWTRVRYTNNAQVDTLAGPDWVTAGGFGTVRVDFIQLMNDGADGGGVVVLDNIDVNTHLIGA